MKFLNWLFRPELTATKALKILAPIPAKDFITGRMYSGDKCCSVGYLRKAIGGDPGKKVPSVEKFCSKKVSRFMRKEHGISLVDNLTAINDDNSYNGYTEGEAKERVIHLLKDMIKAGY